MSHAAPSALITDMGQRVLLRIQARFYELSQDELRSVLGVPPGRPGLGISIDGDQLTFEFAADGRTVTLSATQLHRRLTKHTTTATSKQAKIR